MGKDDWNAVLPWRMDVVWVTTAAPVSHSHTESAKRVVLAPLLVALLSLLSLF
jgi:hypothetical protein